MKNFLIVVIPAILAVLVVLNLNKYRRFLLKKNEANYMYNLVGSSKKKRKTKHLLIGDSVCRQLFRNDENEELFSLCRNQGIEAPGNYILLLNQLEVNAQFDTLSLVVTPFPLQFQTNQSYTYNYFIKPFWDELNKLDQEDQDYLKDLYPIDFLNFLNMNRYSFSNFNLPKEKNFSNPTISELNKKYIKKIISKCEKEGVVFQIVSSPVSTYFQSKLDSLKYFESKNNWGKDQKYINHYFDNIEILDDSLFSDHVHFKNPDHIDRLAILKRGKL